MKKFVVFILALISFFSLASYVSRIDDNNLITLDEVSAFASEKDYTGENLLGQNRENIISLWGEPDSTLSGFWGDIWRLNNEGNEQIILYYNKAGVVDEIKIVKRDL